MASTMNRIGLVQIGVIALTLITALIHLILAFAGGGIMFVLNALGYVALLAGLYAPLPQLAPRRKLVRYALIAYTALTVILWLLMGERTAIGYLNKLVEAVLIALLIMEARQT